MPEARKAAGLAWPFLRLGLVSFGGPVAHLGYFRREFVEKRQWLDDEAFADLVALCQLLPGPASSQVAFGLGMRRAGLVGGLVASIAFLIPSAVLMILFAYGIGSSGYASAAGWLHGLRLAAIAVVAVALWGMARSLCPDWRRRVLAAAAATLVLLVQGPWVQVGVILLWAVIGMLMRFRVRRTEAAAETDIGGRREGAALLALFALLLVALPVAASGTGFRSIAIFDSFYRTGALVFGGGHAVLPLLRSELVPRGWIGDGAFLAGYGAVQAMPGPLFSFAGYLGTAIDSGPHAWVGGLLALVALFLPGWLLVAGAYPYWKRLRSRRWFQGAVRGASAAVVGILFAALCSPLIAEGVRKPADIVAACAAVGLLTFSRIPQWALVLVMAAAGQWLLR